MYKRMEKTFWAESNMFIDHGFEKKSHGQYYLKQLLKTMDSVQFYRVFK